MQVLLQVQRGREVSKGSMEGCSYKKLRLLPYSDEKKQVLLQNKKKSGHWKYDPEFPGDDDEVFVLVADDAKFETKRRAPDVYNDR